LQTEAENLFRQWQYPEILKMDLFTLRMRFSRIIWAIFSTGGPLKNPPEYPDDKRAVFSNIIC